MNAPKKQTILVVGASGYFGSLLVEELLKYSDCRIILGARTLPRLENLWRKWPNEWRERTEIRTLDLTVTESLASALSEVQIAVCAAGPFQSLPQALLQACLTSHVHYIDLSDDRVFVREAHRLCEDSAEQENQIAVCSGWSSMPALSALLTDLASEGMDKIERINIQIAPGNRFPRSYGTVASLLESVGRPFKVWQQDQWVTVTGWSNPQDFQFPPPIGRRIGYIVDVPDHELFPGLFHASTVEFRVGAEIALFNQACSLLAWCAKIGIVKTWTDWAPILRIVMSLAGSLGHDWGALGVQCIGSAKGIKICRQATIIANHQGQYIPVLAATTICIRLLQSEQSLKGAVRLRGWLSRDDLERECHRRNFQLVVKDIATGRQ